MRAVFLFTGIFLFVIFGMIVHRMIKDISDCHSMQHLEEGRPENWSPIEQYD